MKNTIFLKNRQKSNEVLLNTSEMLEACEKGNIFALASLYYAIFDISQDKNIGYEHVLNILYHKKINEIIFTHSRIFQHMMTIYKESNKVYDRKIIEFWEIISIMTDFSKLKEINDNSCNILKRYVKYLFNIKEDELAKLYNMFHEMCSLQKDDEIPQIENAVLSVIAARFPVMQETTKFIEECNGKYSSPELRDKLKKNISRIRCWPDKTVLGLFLNTFQE